VLEWLHQQGAATPEDCRAANNEALCSAVELAQESVLMWLDERGVCTLKDCRALKNCDRVMQDMFRRLAPSRSRRMAEWLAERMDLADFTVPVTAVEIWWLVWRRKVLLLVLADRRLKRRRPPPELWEYIEGFC
jgi:hypothetical protein